MKGRRQEETATAGEGGGSGAATPRDELEKVMKNTEETEKDQAEKTELEKKTAPKKNWSAAAEYHQRNKATQLQKLMENTEETEKDQAEKTEKTNPAELEMKTSPKRNLNAAAAEHHRRTAMRHGAGPKWRARGPRGKGPTSPD